jgi:hypothetical protein
VQVSGVRLRLDLHSPLPAGSITDYKDAPNTVGGLASEPAGVIRTWEMFQLHVAYSWRTLLASQDDLQVRW